MDPEPLSDGTGKIAARGCTGALEAPGTGSLDRYAQPGCLTIRAPMRPIAGNHSIPAFPGFHSLTI